MDQTTVSHARCLYALLELLAAGDPRALPCLLMHYAPRTRQILKRQFKGHISEEDINDIIATALLKAVAKGPTFDQTKASLSTWFTLLARYEALNFLRHHIDADDLEPIVARIASHETHTIPPPEDPSPEIAALLRQLPQRENDLIRMYYYEGLTTSDMANRLGVKESTIESALSRTRKALRALCRPEPPITSEN